MPLVVEGLFDLQSQSVLHALDQLISSGLSALSSRLHSAGLHIGTLDLLPSANDDGLIKQTDAIFDALRVLRTAEQSLLEADSLESMRLNIRKVASRLSGNQRGTSIRDVSVAISALRSTVRVLGLQYCLLRYSLAGLVTAKARHLAHALRDCSAAGPHAPSTLHHRNQIRVSPAEAHFSAADYEWLGFDLDHSLVVYKQVCGGSAPPSP